jgi:Glycosyl hydrolases family 2, TIM barrel domain/Glycosyl hydrolases family 2
MSMVSRAAVAMLGAVAVCSVLPVFAHAAGPPRPILLDGQWEIRDELAEPAPPQPAPPEESQEGQGAGVKTPTLVPPRVRASQLNQSWRPVHVPSVFSAEARTELFGGTVKTYRLQFRGPRTRAFSWAFRFEQSRRRTIVSLNGRRIGISIDPYTPFEIPARGLVRGGVNTLMVRVDSRRDPRTPEGWWNWGGITRPVTLVPRGRAYIRDPAFLSEVACKGPARRCKASVLIDGVLSKLPRERVPGPRKGKGAAQLPQPTLAVRLRAPDGRILRRRFKLRGLRRGVRRLRKVQFRVPAPKLWSPDRPQLYDARAVLSYRGGQQQVIRRRIGLRSVKVKRGLIYLNNRAINIRGASMHEDMPGDGAAITPKDMDTMVRELKELGANTTRAHYVLSEGLLNRLDRAGIMVWNEAPVWQRDHGANLLRFPLDRARAVAQVDRTVKAARSHPSVITHSVANELSFTPDSKPATRRFLVTASKRTRDLDPTLPVALDIKGRPGFSEQFTYQNFDIIGINQYFGWYPWVADFTTLEPFLREMHDNYPSHALVMTEFGAEGRGDMADKPVTQKGSYAFQKMHVARTLGVVERLPFLSGAIHWTLREFEIYPGWSGGAPLGSGANTRHYKGVLTYDGQRKPAWDALHDEYARTPLYR